MIKQTITILKGITWTVLIALLLVIGATFIPIPGNYKIFNVQSGSMEPEIKLGSLIFVKSAKDYQVGDIVTFKTTGEKNTVTHRLIEKKYSENGLIYLTKGDANEEADPQSFGAEKIVGKVFFTLPYLGYPVGYAQTKIGFILLVLIPSVIIVYDEIRNIAFEIRKKIAAFNSRATLKE